MINNYRNNTCNYIEFATKEDALLYLEHKEFFLDGIGIKGVYTSYWSDKLKCSAQLFGKSS